MHVCMLTHTYSMYVSMYVYMTIVYVRTFIHTNIHACMLTYIYVYIYVTRHDKTRLMYTKYTRSYKTVHVFIVFAICKLHKIL